MSEKGLKSKIRKFVKKLVDRFVGEFKSGEWFIVVGGFSFIYDFTKMMFATAETAIHEVTLSNLSNSILLDVVIMGIGVVIWHMDKAFGEKKGG